MLLLLASLGPAPAAEHMTTATPLGGPQLQGPPEVTMGPATVEARFGADIDEVDVQVQLTLEATEGATVRLGIPLSSVDPQGAERVTLSVAGTKVGCLPEALPEPRAATGRWTAAAMCVAEVALPAGATTVDLALRQQTLFAFAATSSPPGRAVGDRAWAWASAAQLPWGRGPATTTLTLQPGSLGERVVPRGEGWSATVWGPGVPAGPLLAELRVADLDRVQAFTTLSAASWERLAVRAASVLDDQGENSYGPEHLVDGDPTTAWCEGVEGSGVGSWVELRFQGTPKGTLNLATIPGYAKSERHWAMNGRAAELVVSACDGGAAAAVPLGAAERGVPMVHPFGNHPLSATVAADPCVRVEVSDVTPGRTYEDTCLSELVLWWTP